MTVSLTTVVAVEAVVACLVAAAAVAVAVVDDNWRQKQPEMRALTVA